MKNKSIGTSPAYNPVKIEKKWQKKWASAKIYKSNESAKKDKFYVLDMFPYPSGEGLHVGHPKGYIATDIISRMNRMQGKNVLHPMGFDAFGLPAENYALKMKKNPMDLTEVNVNRFKEQLELIGLDYDWSREVNTTDPEYYKWTQWAFLQMYKKGLAYESFEPINWCPSCKTGLANEDVEDGRCERCGTPVEKKPLRQWVLKITDYAERLLKDLDVKTGIPLLVHTKSEDAVKKGEPFVERWPVVCIIKHWSEDKYLCINWKADFWKGFVIGGIEGDESPADAAIREIKEETGYQDIKYIKEVGKVDSKFYQKVKKVNRFAHFTGVYVELTSDKKTEISEDEKKLHDLVWVSKNEMESFITHEDMRYIWDLFTGKEKQEIRPLLDWPNSIKEAQRNWIGKSEGALIKFSIINDQSSNKSQKEIEVFTTRPDTLFGVTYVVLAPEYALVGELINYVSNKKEVESYVAQAKLESEIERTDAKKEKTGVELKGVKVINPANGEEVPVWIADYVLADYGTGAVMAVPAHDDRDYIFAKKFNLTIRNVIVPTFGELNPKAEKTEGSAVVIFDQNTKSFGCLHWHNPEIYTLVTGGRESDDTSFEDTAKRELEEETGITKVISWYKLGEDIFCNYWSPAKKVFKSARSFQFLAIVDSKDIGQHKREEYEKFDLEWKSADELMLLFEKTVPKSRHFFEILARAVFKLKELGLDTKTDIKKLNFIKPVPFTEEGILVNSGSFSGKSSDSVRKDITLSVGGKWVTKFKLRDWVFSRQRYWGEPIPLIHCEKCGIVPVPEKDLPVELPKVKSYEPTGTGESPLAAIEKWVNVKCPKCRGKAKRETNTMPQWAGSSWYYLRYMDPKNKKALLDPKKEKYWAPVDLYVGGAEHATRHLIYARFWHKFLYDIGAVSTIEPFIKLQSVGLIMGEDGRKMSKRFGNVVNPDDIVKNYGADSLRLYEMFMGPFDQSIAWSTSSIVGVRRFIEKVWRLRERVKIQDSRFENATQNSNAVDKILHKAIKKVTADIQVLGFNTAISTLMITVNEIEKIIAEDSAAVINRVQFEIILKLLAPFAPHVTEELWYSLGNKKSIHVSEWPVCDERLIVEDEVQIMVQVNGKVRGSFKAQKDLSEAILEAQAKEIPDVKKWLDGKSVKKVIVIKGKLVSIVVS